MPLTRYCSILLAFFCSCSLGALDHSDDYQNVPDSYRYSQFTFSDGETWSAAPNLPYTSVIGCSPTNVEFPYRYFDYHPFVDISYTGGYLRSAQLSNVTSVTIVLARTFDPYTDPYRVVLESATVAEPTNFTPVTTVDAVNYISSDMAKTYKDCNYDSGHFTAFTYDFPSPFTGILRFTFPAASQTLRDTYNAFIPSFMIADISLTRTQPCNCFSVTVH